MVSVSVAFCRVSVPVLARTTWYRTSSPIPGLAGAWVCPRVNPTTGAAGLNPVAFEARESAEHGPVAVTNAVFEIVVAPHTGPTWPVSVNVQARPGSRPAQPSCCPEKYMTTSMRPFTVSARMFSTDSGKGADVVQVSEAMS